jgi:hypothetical protein
VKEEEEEETKEVSATTDYTDSGISQMKRREEAGSIHLLYLSCISSVLSV